MKHQLKTAMIVATLALSSIFALGSTVQAFPKIDNTVHQISQDSNPNSEGIRNIPQTTNIVRNATIPAASPNDLWLIYLSLSPIYSYQCPLPCAYFLSL